MVKVTWPTVKLSYFNPTNMPFKEKHLFQVGKDKVISQAPSYQTNNQLVFVFPL